MSMIPPRESPPVNRTVVIVCVTLLTLAMFGLYGWVSYKGGSVSSLLQFLGVSIVPTATAMASYLSSSGVRRVVDRVQEQTNGNTTRLLDIAQTAVQAMPPSAPSTPTPPASATLTPTTPPSPPGG